MMYVNVKRGINKVYSKNGELYQTINKNADNDIKLQDTVTVEEENQICIKADKFSLFNDNIDVYNFLDIKDKIGYRLLRNETISQFNYTQTIASNSQEQGIIIGYQDGDLVTNVVLKTINESTPNYIEGVNKVVNFNQYSQYSFKVRFVVDADDLKTCQQANNAIKLQIQKPAIKQFFQGEGSRLIAQEINVYQIGSNSSTVYDGNTNTCIVQNIKRLIIFYQNYGFIKNKQVQIVGYSIVDDVQKINVQELRNNQSVFGKFIIQFQSTDYDDIENNLPNLPSIFPSLPQQTIQVLENPENIDQNDVNEPIQQKDDELFKVLENITNVQNEKIKRCQIFSEQEQIYLCYKENNAKEELVLEHVMQFKHQFQYQLYFEDKRDLFLYPKNEYGIQKFICTTIRPTKLGFLELYDYASCAKYLSSFVQFEELDPPNQFPQIIPSPTNVAVWQKGDCFDMSILLCSLLIGVGYEAYCLYGKAPREISSKNEALMEYLYLEKGKYIPEEEKKQSEQEKNEIAKEQKNVFVINKKQMPYSKWDKKIQDKLESQIKEKQKLLVTIDDDEPDELLADPYEGQRIHCWVLIRPGKRGVKKNIFVEPSTGRVYDPLESPYESVDCVFNNKNFWINMQQNLNVKNLNFDEMDISLNWEYVMLDTLQFAAPPFQDDQENEDIIQKQQKNPEQEQIEDLAQILDMPPPWAPKIYIDKEAFMKGSPLGEGTTFFNKVRVDTFAPYCQKDGLVQKITIFEDYKRLKIKEYRYFYQHRSDKLYLRRRYPFEFKTIEEYEMAKYENKQIPQALQQWKQIICIDRRMKIINYYENRNHDGLIQRQEIIGEKTILKYKNRDDRIIYRSIRFCSKKSSNNFINDKVFVDNNIGEVYILKITQKYSKNLYQNANDQIAKIIIDFIQDEVVVYFHLNEGEITPIVKIYQRDQLHGFQKTSEQQDSNKLDDHLVQLEYSKMVNLEKECINQLKQAEKVQKDDEVIMRETELKLELALHDKARERFKQKAKKNEEQALKDAAQNDYLYNYLEKRGLLNVSILTYQNALEVKNEVMQKLKDKLLSRAEIIQKRIEYQKNILEQKEYQVSKKQEIDAKLEEEIKEINFKIDILEQRALRFESIALQKYEEIDNKLNNDVRLQALQKK
ncbi:hypothetical protein IMG5_178860 [Ichthyophthirius multifiliis]|uniref:Uncharacterized protein n=1 Tax=Ichthyophthirius multifiliis TaxID=5932 RepID=G0R2J4_ICHMU|nr:hypothetical protein IMG5_178860 [Ichthyophthirius multifiliis]EGR28306.1 hypothetical protein IMG5_178860 [Ichthyophthirius multifiliis]|eukprot:XP_004027651.1 hypothetical protein IMG5_178860 [Ichthyophthirius multifiliis]